MRTIEYNGVKVEYDERCVKSYRWQKAVNSGNPKRSANAMSRLFAGRDEYYAYAIGTENPMGYDEWAALSDDELDLLDDNLDAMGGLLSAVVEDMGQTAKN